MPTNTNPTSRFATLSASQVLIEQDRLLESWTARDQADDAARRDALLAKLASL